MQFAVTEYMQKHREAAVGLCMGAAGTFLTLEAPFSSIHETPHFHTRPLSLLITLKPRVD